MNRDDDHARADDAAFEMFLAVGREARVKPTSDLMARIMVDALAEMPTKEAPVARRGVGLRARVVSLFGGWGSMGGLVAATLAGVWIGFAAPGPLAALTTDVLDTTATSTVTVDTLELMPEFDDFLSEG